MDNDEDNSIRHYQLDDEAVNFFPRVPGDTTTASAISLFKRGNHGMCGVLTLSSLVLVVVVMIMGGVVGVRKRRLQGRRQRRGQGYVKRRGRCGRKKSLRVWSGDEKKKEEEEFTRGGDDDEEEEFAKKCFVYNQNFEKRNWNFDALERGLGVVREEEEEEEEEKEEEEEGEEEEAAGENGNQNQNGRPLILHHHHVSLKAPVVVDLEDV